LLRYEDFKVQGNATFVEKVKSSKDHISVTPDPILTKFGI